MEQKEKRYFLGLEIEPDAKRWLELQAAKRLEEGRPFGERSIGAVVRDLIDERRDQSEREAA